MEIPGNFNTSIDDIGIYLVFFSNDPDVDAITLNISKDLLKAPLSAIEIKLDATEHQIKFYFPNGLNANLSERDLSTKLGISLQNTYDSLVRIKEKEKKTLQDAIKQMTQDFEKGIGHSHAHELLKTLDGLFRDLNELNPELSKENISNYIFKEIGEKKDQIFKILWQYLDDCVPTIEEHERKLSELQAAKNARPFLKNFFMDLFSLKGSLQKEIDEARSTLKKHIDDLGYNINVLKKCFPEKEEEIADGLLNFKQKNSNESGQEKGVLGRILRFIKHKFFTSKDIKQTQNSESAVNSSLPVVSPMLENADQPPERAPPPPLHRASSGTSGSGSKFWGESKAPVSLFSVARRFFQR